MFLPAFSQLYELQVLPFWPQKKKEKKDYASTKYHFFHHCSKGFSSIAIIIVPAVLMITLTLICCPNSQALVFGVNSFNISSPKEGRSH